MGKGFMNVPLADPGRQYLDHKEEIDSVIQKVLNKGNFVMGEEVEAFEHEWAKYCGAKYCVALSSCSDALFIALKLVELKRVLTTSLTFFATVAMAVLAGKEVFFKDVGEDDACVDTISLDYFEGIFLPVHLYGCPCKTVKLPKAFVIEDGAQSHGQPLRGNILCSSFYPTKNLGAFGMAGALVTNDENFYKLAKSARVHGEKERFVHYGFFGNYRMDEVQAAILRVKLKYLDDWNSSRVKIAERYRAYLENIEGIKTQVNRPGHNYHIFAIRVKDRDSLGKYLNSREIQTSVRYPIPIHLLPVFKGAFNKGQYPIAEAWAREVITLPCYPELSMDQVDYVAQEVLNFIVKGARSV